MRSISPKTHFSAIKLYTSSSVVNNNPVSIHKVGASTREQDRTDGLKFDGVYLMEPNKYPKELTLSKQLKDSVVKCSTALDSSDSPFFTMGIQSLIKGSKQALKAPLNINGLLNALVLIAFYLFETRAHEPSTLGALFSSQPYEYFKQELAVLEKSLNTDPSSTIERCKPESMTIFPGEVQFELPHEVNLNIERLRKIKTNKQS